MKNRGRGLLLVGVMLLAAVASVPPEGHLANAAEDDLVVEAWLDGDGRLRIADLPPGSLDECGICDYCPVAGSMEDGHLAIDTPVGAAGRGDGWHIYDDCLPGNCIDEHPYVMECILGKPHEYLQAAELAALWSEIRDGTVAGSELAASYPGNVEWNSERHALQVFDCGGGLVAHVPVKAAQ